jgi:hypothetical protein
LASGWRGSSRKPTAVKIWDLGKKVGQKIKEWVSGRRAKKAQDRLGKLGTKKLPPGDGGGAQLRAGDGGCTPSGPLDAAESFSDLWSFDIEDVDTGNHKPADANGDGKVTDDEESDWMRQVK